MPDEDGDLVYPSCVFYPKDSDSPWVGAKAKRRSIYYPGRVFHDSQIMLGKLMNDPVIQYIKPFWPFEVEQSETGEILYKLSDVQKFRPEDI